MKKWIACQGQNRKLSREQEIDKNMWYGPFVLFPGANLWGTGLCLPSPFLIGTTILDQHKRDWDLFVKQKQRRFVALSFDSLSNQMYKNLIEGFWPQNPQNPLSLYY